MCKRLRLVVGGIVQGVGMRPFVYRLAKELGLCGWVRNSTIGVEIEVEGEESALESMRSRILTESPPQSSIDYCQTVCLQPVGYTDFQILQSRASAPLNVMLTPDLATCSECIAEMLDPNNRRYLHPFITCTNCGPRYSIITGLPYDRTNTTMQQFEMCSECRREYHNPSDRRFHAQPICCNNCGPTLQLQTREHIVATAFEAVERAAEALLAGQIVAVKGIGGFHLCVDARDENAVSRLRLKKHREQKPLALLYPDLKSLQNDCQTSPQEELLLGSAAAPILILESRQNPSIARNVAPGAGSLGAMLPNNPVQHLLMRTVGIPVVATSANLTDEPVAIDIEDVIRTGIADLYLTHNRPIAHRVDDSIVRVLAGNPVTLRLARGYAPLQIKLESRAPQDAIALGGHLKSSLAVLSGDRLVLSQHIGDLSCANTSNSLLNTSKELTALLGTNPNRVVCDLHPDYASTRLASSLGINVRQIQHHQAHIAACMLDNSLNQDLLGVAWDGSGYGLDGTIWGGEFITLDRSGFYRIAHLRQFPLIGGESAVKEPRRSALGLLYEIYGDDAWTHPTLSRMFAPTELKLLRNAMTNQINCPRTSSAGRLFDAVAALCGLCYRSQYEGHAAILLEAAIKTYTSMHYDFELQSVNGVIIVDWEPMLKQILTERDLNSVPVRFHNTLAEMIALVAHNSHYENIVLTGGCFQNRYLTEKTVDRLRTEGFRPYWHQHIPPNDGGLSAGQIFSTIINNSGSSQ